MRATDGHQLKVVAAVLALWGVSLCALALAVLLLRDDFVLSPWLGHPFVIGFGGCVVLAVSWGLGIAHLLVKLVGVTLLAMAAVGALGLGWLMATFDEDLEEVSRQRSPDGALDLVVYASSTSFAPDPTRELRVYTTTGLLTRVSDLGCVNLESDQLDGVAWVDTRTVRIRTRDETSDVAVNDRGRPGQTVHAGC